MSVDSTIFPERPLTRLIKLEGWTAFAKNILLVFVALIFLFTGIVHIGNSYFFLSSVVSYDLVSFHVAKQLAIILPILHIVLAVLILCDFFRYSALQIASAVFTMYFVAQFSVLVRGIEIDCGCFGIDSDRIGTWSVARVFCLVVLTVFLFLCETRCDKKTA